MLDEREPTSWGRVLQPEGRMPVDGCKSSTLGRRGVLRTPSNCLTRPVDRVPFPLRGPALASRSAGMKTENALPPAFPAHCRNFATIKVLSVVHETEFVVVN